MTNEPEPSEEPGRCCEGGMFREPHECRKSPGWKCEMKSAIGAEVQECAWPSCGCDPELMNPFNPHEARQLAKQLMGACTDRHITRAAYLLAQAADDMQPCSEHPEAEHGWQCAKCDEENYVDSMRELQDRIDELEGAAILDKNALKACQKELAALQDLTDGLRWEYEDQIKVNITDAMYRASRIRDGVRMYPWTLSESGAGRVYLEAT